MAKIPINMDSIMNARSMLEEIVGIFNNLDASQIVTKKEDLETKMFSVSSIIEKEFPVSSSEYCDTRVRLCNYKALLAIAKQLNMMAREMPDITIEDLVPVKNKRAKQLKKMLNKFDDSCDINMNDIKCHEMGK